MQDTNEKHQDVQTIPEQTNTNEPASSTEDAEASNNDKQTKSTTYTVRRGEPITFTVQLSAVVSPTAVRKAKMSSTEKAVNPAEKPPSIKVAPESPKTSEANENENNESNTSEKIAPIDVNETITQIDVPQVEANHDMNDANIEQDAQPPKNSAMQTTVIAAVAAACVSVILFLQLRRWKRH